MRISLGTTVLTRDLENNSLAGIATYTQLLANALQNYSDCTLIPYHFKHYPLQALLSTVSGFPFRLSGSVSAFSSGNGSRESLALRLTCPRNKQRRLPLSQEIDLFHATDHYIPKLKVPVIATLHDAIHMAHPEWYPARLYSFKKFLWKRVAHWANHVITPSEYSKQQVMAHFQIAENKITVIPHGVENSYFEKVDPEETRLIQKRLALPEKFFLFIGTLQPRKNILRLIAAHRALPLTLQKEFPLLLAGSQGWRSQDIMAELQKVQHETIRWLGQVNLLEKKILLQSATGLVFPTLAEGFGLPVLEAFASELPIITSNSTALLEVAGDAAILIDPLDVDSLAEAMKRIACDAALQESLKVKGVARAKNFTWEKCAAKTREVYQRFC